MPLIIGEMSTSLEIQDEAKIRKLVKQMIRDELRELKLTSRGTTGEADPADPAAGGAQEGGS